MSLLSPKCDVVSGRSVYLHLVLIQIPFVLSQNVFKVQYYHNNISSDRYILIPPFLTETTTSLSRRVTKIVKIYVSKKLLLLEHPNPNS